jgi:hypothetical protein
VENGYKGGMSGAQSASAAHLPAAGDPSLFSMFLLWGAKPNRRFATASGKSAINHAIGLSEDELIRKLVLGKMQRSEYTNGRNEEIKASW